MGLVGRSGGATPKAKALGSQERAVGESQGSPAACGKQLREKGNKMGRMACLVISIMVLDGLNYKLNFTNNTGSSEWPA